MKMVERKRQMIPNREGMMNFVIKFNKIQIPSFSIIKETDLVIINHNQDVLFCCLIDNILLCFIF